MKVESYLDKKDLERVKHRVVSFGAGTQSTAMLLMGLEGELHARPDFAVFSDTGGEPDIVYDYLNMITEFVKKEYDFDIYTAKPDESILKMLSNPSISKKTGKKYYGGNPPFFIKNDIGDIGMLMRQCTGNYKIDPFNKFVKNRLNIGRKNKDQSGIVEIWMGISLDEMQRMKQGGDWWSVLRYPLIEKEMLRYNSIRYVEKMGLPTPPRSACFFCPYHSQYEWTKKKNEYPKEFQKAVDLEREVQNIMKDGSSLNGIPYLTSAGINLDKIEFNKNQCDMFESGFVDECDGVCGI